MTSESPLPIDSVVIDGLQIGGQRIVQDSIEFDIATGTVSMTLIASEVKVNYKHNREKRCGA